MVVCVKLATRDTVIVRCCGCLQEVGEEWNMMVECRVNDERQLLGQSQHGLNGDHVPIIDPNCQQFHEIKCGR